MRMTFFAGAIGLLGLGLLAQPAIAHDGHKQEANADHAAGHSAAHGTDHDSGEATAQIGAIAISEVWARATIAGQKTAAGYMTLQNSEASGDTLLSVASPAAERVEVHSMEMKNDTMIMRPVEGGLAIPAEGTIELAPGGFHLMFLNINHDFKAGDTVQVSLTFANAGTVELDMPVRAPGTKAAGSSGGHGADAGHHNH